MEDELNILKTGNGWIGIDKPCGMSVHNAPGKDVVSILTSMILKGAVKGIKCPLNNAFKVQPAHRLDKDTSGVLILAYTREALARLSACFKNREVDKTYIALVHGNIDPKDMSHGNSGDENTDLLPVDKLTTRVWNFPLSKDAGGRKNPAGRGRKVKAETRYRILRQTAHYALLDIHLMTGRKHQIRRHAKLAGHPVTGDQRYGSKRSVDYLRKNLGYDRLGLHGVRLVIHGMNPPISLESPELPRKMKDLLDQDDQQVITCPQESSR